MSHGTQEDRAEVIAAIRALEKEVGRPMTILVDLQGPKLRIGTFKEGLVQLGRGDLFVLDRSSAPGDKTRVCLPHRELFQALQPGSSLLLDDGKHALRLEKVEPERIATPVEVGGALSNPKGANGTEERRVGNGYVR